VWSVITFGVLVAECLQYKPVKKVTPFSNITLYGLSAYYLHGLLLVCT
jgi:hypothetical protein